MDPSGLSRAAWRRSTRSGENGGNCVEVAALPQAVAVRDSKDQFGPVLTFSPTTWNAFLAGLHRNGSVGR